MVSPNGQNRFFRQPSRLECLERSVSALIDFTIAIEALLEAKGYIGHQEMMNMEPLVTDVRRRLGVSFDIASGIQAVIATYKLQYPVKKE